MTPFLLSRLLEFTGGRSLVTNIALVKNNAALAAEVAVARRCRGEPLRRGESRAAYVRNKAEAPITPEAEEAAPP